MDNPNLLNWSILTRNTLPLFFPPSISLLPSFFLPPSLFYFLSFSYSLSSSSLFLFFFPLFRLSFFSLLGPDAFPPNPALDDNSYSSIFLSHSILCFPLSIHRWQALI